MNIIDYVVLGGLVTAVVCVVMWIIRRKKQGKGGCGCCPQRQNCDKFVSKK